MNEKFHSLTKKRLENIKQSGKEGRNCFKIERDIGNFQQSFENFHFVEGCSYFQRFLVREAINNNKKTKKEKERKRRASQGNNEYSDIQSLAWKQPDRKHLPYFAR